LNFALKLDCSGKSQDNDATTVHLQIQATHATTRSSNSVIHVVQRLERGTCHHSTTPAGFGLPVQRPDPTDRRLNFRSSFVTPLFRLSLHCVRLLRRQTETPPALHFVIVCTSNSVIHVVQRLERGTCHHSTTATGSR